MGEAVKRDYRSQLRAEQARATRRSIVSSAAQLFSANGYGATTIDAVAAAAGVSRKTVFTAVGGKLELLKTALDWAVAGDDEPVSLADRASIGQLLDEDDPEALLAGWARLLAAIDARVAPLFQALEVAASADAEAAELLTRSQRDRSAGARAIVERLCTLGALTAELTVAQAVDVAWLATDPILYDRMVRIRGWSATRFAQWLGRTLSRHLLAPDSARRPAT